MSRVTLKLPETLHQQLERLARSEGVTLNQYIVFALARQAAMAYTVEAVPEKQIAQQRVDFAALLHSLGQASFAEIEKVMQRRELVKAEKGLTSDVVKSLQHRIANQQRPD